MINDFLWVLREDLAQWEAMGRLRRDQRRQVRRLLKAITNLEDYLVGPQPDDDTDTEGDPR